MSAPGKTILICSQDPIFIKGLYGPLRDAGYEIEINEHPNEAVRSVLQTDYFVVVMDSGDFGLSTADASAIIKSIRPDIHIILMADMPDERDMHTVKRTDALAHIRTFLSPYAGENSLQAHLK
jgi:CheY-like chemotaxis protein